MNAAARKPEISGVVGQQELITLIGDKAKLLRANAPKHSSVKPDKYLGIQRVSLDKQDWTKANESEECSCAVM